MPKNHRYAYLKCKLNENVMNNNIMNITCKLLFFIVYFISILNPLEFIEFETISQIAVL